MHGARANNLDLLRLTAATAVVASHAAQLSDRGGTDPLLALTGSVSVGLFAVWVFFCVSGFLVTESWLRDPRLLEFAARRLLRIGPGLLVAVGVALFLVGPLFSSLGPGRYLSDPSAWSYSATALLYSQQYTLPGVFTTNHWGPDVNSSLWTLRYELLCYLLVPLVVGLRRRWGRQSVATLLLCGLSIAVLVPRGQGIPLPGQVELRTLAEMTAFFSAGMLLRLWLDRLPMRRDLACCGAALTVAGLAWPGAFVAIPLGLAYVSVYLGTATRPRRLPLIGSNDLSYGVYIYGFMVEQAVIDLLGGSASPGVVFALGLPVTLAMAFASWRFVEKPALRLKRRLVWTTSGIRVSEAAPSGGSVAPAVT